MRLPACRWRESAHVYRFIVILLSVFSLVVGLRQVEIFKLFVVYA